MPKDPYPLNDPCVLVTDDYEDLWQVFDSPEKVLACAPFPIHPDYERMARSVAHDEPERCEFIEAHGLYNYFRRCIAGFEDAKEQLLQDVFRLKAILQHSFQMPEDVHMPRMELRIHGYNAGGAGLQDWHVDRLNTRNAPDRASRVVIPLVGRGMEWVHPDDAIVDFSNRQVGTTLGAKTFRVDPGMVSMHNFYQPELPPFVHRSSSFETLDDVRMLLVMDFPLYASMLR